MNLLWVFFAEAYRGVSQRKSVLPYPFQLIIVYYEVYESIDY